MKRESGFPYFAGDLLPQDEQEKIGESEKRFLGVVGETDDRRAVLDTRVPGFRLLVRLRAELAGFPPQSGTGFLISPRTILTAAHVLCSRSVNGPLVLATRVLAAPAAAGVGRYPYGEWECSDIRIASRYASLQDPTSDYGVIQLPEELGRRLGWFGLRAFSDSQLRGSSFSLFGYPDPEPPRPPRGPILEDTMWGMSGAVIGAVAYLTYSIDASFGQSGAPIFFRLRNNGQDLFYAAGIHQAGNYRQNHAVRLRPAVLQEIRQWML